MRKRKRKPNCTATPWLTWTPSANSKEKLQAGRNLRPRRILERVVEALSAPGKHCRVSCLAGELGEYDPVSDAFSLREGKKKTAPCRDSGKFGPGRRCWGGAAAPVPLGDAGKCSRSCGLSEALPLQEVKIAAFV